MSVLYLSLISPVLNLVRGYSRVIFSNILYLKISESLQKRFKGFYVRGSRTVIGSCSGVSVKEPTGLVGR